MESADGGSAIRRRGESGGELMEKPIATFIHPDLLRTPNFGGNEEAIERFFARIERESREMEELLARGIPSRPAWAFVKLRSHTVN